MLLQGSQEEAEWSETFAQYKTKYPEEAEEFEMIMSGKLPDGWDKVLPEFTPEDKARKHPAAYLPVPLCSSADADACRGSLATATDPLRRRTSGLLLPHHRHSTSTLVYRTVLQHRHFAHDH